MIKEAKMSMSFLTLFKKDTYEARAKNTFKEVIELVIQKNSMLYKFRRYIAIGK